MPQKWKAKASSGAELQHLGDISVDPFGALADQSHNPFVLHQWNRSSEQLILYIAHKIDLITHTSSGTMKKAKALTLASVLLITLLKSLSERKRRPGSS